MYSGCFGPIIVLQGYKNNLLIHDLFYANFLKVSIYTVEYTIAEIKPTLYFHLPLVGFFAQNFTELFSSYSFTLIAKYYLIFLL